MDYFSMTPAEFLLFLARSDSGGGGADTSAKFGTAVFGTARFS